MLMIGNSPKDFPFRSNIDSAKRRSLTTGPAITTFEDKFDLDLLTLWSWSSGRGALAICKKVKLKMSIFRRITTIYVSHKANI